MWIDPGGVALGAALLLGLENAGTKVQGASGKRDQVTLDVFNLHQYPSILEKFQLSTVPCNYNGEIQINHWSNVLGCSKDTGDKSSWGAFVLGWQTRGLYRLNGGGSGRKDSLLSLPCKLRWQIFTISTFSYCLGFPICVIFYSTLFYMIFRAKNWTRDGWLGERKRFLYDMLSPNQRLSSVK